MRSSSVCIRLTMAVLVLFTFVHTRVLGYGQYSTNELSQDIAKLDSFLSNRDLESIEATVNKDSAKWQQRDRASYIAYMFKACSLLSSYDIGDLSKRAVLLSQYSMSILTSGDLTLQDNVEFVNFLMSDPLVIDEATWKTLRDQKAELWLAAQRRVKSSIDPKFDVDDLPFINVPTPKGSGARAGSSPESITDPKLRAEYEAAIARNSEKIRHSNEQLWLRRNAPRFYADVERYLVNAYSRPPSDTAELERLLSQYVEDDALRSRILERVRKGQ